MLVPTFRVRVASGRSAGSSSGADAGQGRVAVLGVVVPVHVPVDAAAAAAAAAVDEAAAAPDRGRGEDGAGEAERDGSAEGQQQQQSRRRERDRDGPSPTTTTTTTTTTTQDKRGAAPAGNGSNGHGDARNDGHERQRRQRRTHGDETGPVNAVAAGGVATPRVGTVLTVGRGPASGMVFSDGHVSTRHLTLEVVREDDGSTAVLLHESSSNGTWVNGERLERGDVVRLPDRAEVELPCADEEDKRDFTLIVERLSSEEAAEIAAALAEASSESSEGMEDVQSVSGASPPINLVRSATTTAPQPLAPLPPPSSSSSTTGAMLPNPPSFHPAPPGAPAVRQFHTMSGNARLTRVASGSSVSTTQLASSNSNLLAQQQQQPLPPHHLHGGSRSDWAWDALLGKCDELGKESARLAATVEANGAFSRDVADAHASEKAAHERLLQAGAGMLAALRDARARLLAAGDADGAASVPVEKWEEALGRDALASSASPSSSS